MGTSLESEFARERLKKVTEIVDSVAKDKRRVLGSNVESFKEAAIRNILDSGVDMAEAKGTALVMAMAWVDPDAEEEYEDEEPEPEEKTMSSLVFTRRDQESVVIVLPDGEFITLIMRHKPRSAPKLIIKAPRHIPIWRGEVLEKAAKEKGGQNE